MERAVHEDAGHDLDRFFEDLYEGLLVLYPEVATRTGDHRYDDRLSDPSPAGRARYEAHLRESIEALRAIDASGLGPRRRMSHRLALSWLETEIAGFRFTEHLMAVVDPLQGFQVSLPNLLIDMPYERAEDYEKALARIARFPEYAGRAIETMREGMARGATQARPAVEKVLEQVEAQAGLPAGRHPFFRPFAAISRSIPEAEGERLRGEALRSIEAGVLPALGRFAEHLRSEYLPRARKEAGVWAVPDGREMYAWEVRQATTTALSPEEIHRIGLDESARIRTEMEGVKERTGFSGGLADFFAFLRSDRRFYYERAEDLLAGYRDIAKRADAELPRLFGKLPRIPYGVLPVPDYAAPAAPAAYYQPPPADGSRAGFFYANVHDLPSRPRFEMEALTLHEAVPGHHLQLALQLEIDGLPEFRTRWLTFTAYVEGWGLYAERLGKEIGFYADPYAEFGRLTYERWRAARLVVDTGIHHFRWTREQAADYMHRNSSLTALNIASEVDRYIVWPAQALSYKIGELRILGLRRRAEESLGPLFDLRSFHDRILEEGSLPLDVLEERVDGWIRARRRAARASPKA